MPGAAADPEGPAAAAPGRAVVVGLGASRGCPADELLGLLDATLAAAGRARGDVVAVASADVKADEQAILAAARELGVPLRVAPAADLAAVAVPTPSAVVAAAVGTPSVAEASALLVAADLHRVSGFTRPNGTTNVQRGGPPGPGAGAARPRLVATKRRSAHATCAIAALPDAPFRGETPEGADPGPTPPGARSPGPAGAPARPGASAAPPPTRSVVVATDDCRGCGGCIRTCPEHALVPAPPAARAAGAPPLLTLADRCTGCGECLELCPVDAMTEVTLPWTT